MKIVHIIWALGVGGAEAMLVDIVNEQSETENIHIVIINNHIDKVLLSSMSNKVKVHKINRIPGSRNIIDFIRLNYLLMRMNPDVIHSHNADIINTITIIKILKTRFFLTLHTTNIKSDSFQKYHKIFSISHAVRNDVLVRSGIFTKVVYNGIDIDRFQKKNNLNFEVFRIVQVGRLNNKIKGQEVLLKALRILIHKYTINNIYIDFIGEGESKEELINLAENLQITKYCNFLGKKDREYIYKYLKDYDLLVQPSYYEGFGLTVAEGLAAKVPVLVSDIEGPMEIIKNGKFGFFFRAGDCKDCADKIVDILELYGSSDLHSKIENGHKHVVKKFNIKKTAKRYLNNYVDL